MSENDVATAPPPEAAKKKGGGAFNRETVVEVQHYTDRLFRFRTTRDSAFRFVNGQFAMIGIEVCGKPLLRAYSMASANYEDDLEFFSIKVPDGPLTSRLQHLKVGDSVLVGRKPTGTLVQPNLLPGKRLYMFSTGTGIAPFLSILRSATPWQRFRHVVLVHAVRYAKELVYRDLIEVLLDKRKSAFRYVTFVSREAAPGSLAGRIPAAVRDGRLEAAAALRFAAETSQVLLCGNPAMLKDTSSALAERGMRKHRRRSPGQVTVESFW